MKRRLSTIISVLNLLTIACLNLSGCNASSEALCEGKLSQLDLDLENAVQSLQAWLPTEGRSLASVKMIEILARTDRESWAAWSRVRLKEAQHYMDLADTDPNLKPVVHELSLASDDLVEFHAYAERGLLTPMMKALRSVREHEARAVSFVCPPRPPKSL